MLDGNAVAKSSRLIQLEDYSKAAKCMQELGFNPLPSANIPFTLKYAWAHAFHWIQPDAASDPERVSDALV